MGRRFLLLDDRGRKRIVEEGSRIETDTGIFEIPSPAHPGRIVLSHLGHRAILVEPSVRDFVETMERRTRIPHFEDIGYVLAQAGLREGQTVIEAGTGSGACTLYFSQAVGMAGRVVSFEVREEIYRIAEKNVLGFGCTNVELVNGNIRDKSSDLRADLFFLDLALPSEYLGTAHRSLKPGGLIAVYTPFLEEGARCFRKLSDLGCLEVRMAEISKRDYEVLPAGTRPRTTQTVHTGYLILGRVVMAKDGNGD